MFLFPANFFPPICKCNLIYCGDSSLPQYLGSQRVYYLNTSSTICRLFFPCFGLFFFFCKGVYQGIKEKKMVFWGSRAGVTKTAQAFPAQRASAWTSPSARSWPKACCRALLAAGVVLIRKRNKGQGGWMCSFTAAAPFCSLIKV